MCDMSVLFQYIEDFQPSLDSLGAWSHRDSGHVVTGRGDRCKRMGTYYDTYLLLFPSFPPLSTFPSLFSVTDPYYCLWRRLSYTGALRHPSPGSLEERSHRDSGHVVAGQGDRCKQRGNFKIPAPTMSILAYYH